eukprot:TRINITY_DN4217_c0_g1_i1.p1 TRINITY_DN4217_c0_g1~~TRINITY_DN4217_c0_g1_i1.p1  ORF type:complete len:1816 (+),score=559.90 TRINITY_DN4217_c0_g1_i1:158-5605(+)
MASTDEAEINKDIQLLEQVLTRFAVSSEDQLEKQVKTLMIPVLTKLSSPHEVVRKKVIEVLGHINKLVKPQPSIKLPVRELLNLFLDGNANGLVSNFVMVYLEMGFSRLDLKERVDVAPLLLKNLSKRTQNQRETLIPLFLSAIEHISIPDKVEEMKLDPKFEFASNPEDTEILLKHFADTLLAQVTSNSDDITYGLSKKAARTIASKTPSKEYLLSRKIGIINFLSKSNLFTENEMGFLFIIGSCDPHHTVVQKCEDALKRIKIDYEDKKLVSKIYSLFQGSVDAKDVPPEEQRQPAHPILKGKLVNSLARSVEAANSFPSTIQVIFDCVYGKDTSVKLKSSAMTFIQWVFRQANDKQITAMGPVILSGLLKLLQEMKSVPESTDSNRLLSFTYPAIGLLSRRIPAFFSKDLSILSLMFHNLSETKNEGIQSSIQEGLTMMCPVFRGASKENMDLILQLLEGNSAKDSVASRYVSIYYSNRLLPFSSPFGRMNCLLSSEDSIPIIRDEASKGLRPFSWREQEKDILPDPSVEWPDFLEMVKYVDTIVQKRRNKGVPVFAKNTWKLQGVLHVPCYEQTIKFLRNCLEIGATKLEVKPWRYVRDLLGNEESSLVLENYVKFLDGAMDNSSVSSALTHVASEAILEILSHSLNSKIGEHYAKKNNWISSFIYMNGGHEARDNLAKIIGINVKNLPKDELNSFLDKIITSIHEENDNWEKQLGAAYAVGYVIAGCLKHNISIDEDRILTALYNLYQLLPSPSTTSSNVESHISLLLATVQSIGWIGRYSNLSLIPTGEEWEEKARSTNNYKISSRKELTKRLIVYKLSKLLSHADTRVIERCAIALGNLILGDREADYKEEALKSLYSTGNTKNYEIHFTVGEVLSIIGSGWRSKAAYDAQFEVEEYQNADVLPKSSGERSKTMENLLKEILSKQLSGDRTRSAACIWLLSLVKFTGKEEEVKDQLQTIQTAFSYLLSDSDEITQEAASKGLVFVYEEGDAEMKESLVKNLIETLSTGKKSGFKLSADSEILPANITKTPEGGNVSTYSQLVALATEMGQPSLVYRFLELSSQHTLWNSRKGAAFTVKSILGPEFMEKQMAPVLPQLVPKLYRSSFDPNPKIAESMKNILKSMVDYKKALTDFFPQIMKDLLDAMVTNLWRNRESACSALTEVLQGRSYQEVQPFLGELWYRGFRVIDDIKESVRAVAKSFLKALSALTTRLTDPSLTNPIQVEKILSELLPFLLEKGLISESQDAREISLKQILTTAKVAGHLLIPYVANLVGVLLEGMTSLEPAAFNYLSFHTDKMDISQEKFEEARISISKHSPLNETLDVCIKYVDEKNIGEVVSKIIETIRSGVGLQTKVGAARFLVSLAVQKQELMSPYSGKILNTLLGSMRERSPVIRKSYASALGNVAKFASQKSYKNLLDKLIALYGDVENDDLRVTAGVAFLELIKRSNDQMRANFKSVVPLFYFAKNDPIEEVKKIFGEVWDESGVGGVSLYLPEIVEFLTTSLSSDSWNVKKQAALTFKDLADGSSREMLKYLDKVLGMLVGAIPGRVWKGKDSLLSALSSLSTSYSTEITERYKDGNCSPTSLVDTIIKECKKNDKEYKRQALICLGNILKAFPDLDQYEKTKELLFPIALGKEDSLGSDEGDSKDKPLNFLIRGQAFVDLGYAWAKDVETQRQYYSELLDLLVSNVSKNIWSIRLNIFSSLVLFFEKLNDDVSGKIDESQATGLLETMYEGLGDTKYSMVREGALNVLDSFVVRMQGSALLESQSQNILKKMSEAGNYDNTLQNKIHLIQQKITEHPSKKRKNE